MPETPNNSNFSPSTDNCSSDFDTAPAPASTEREEPAVEALAATVDQLLGQFLAEPAGPARPLIHAYLLAQLANERGRFEEQAIAHAEALRRRAERFRAEAIGLTGENQRLVRERATAQAQRRALHNEMQLIESAVRAKGVTQAEIVERISRAIGLGGPLVERVERACEPNHG